MADPRSIHEFTTGQVEATTFLLGDFVDLDAQSGYTTYKMSVSDLGEVILEDIEYTQDLQTVDKTVIGAINENKSVIGYNYDEYDDTTTSANAYAVDDLCIHNNALYKCIAPTYGAWDSTKWEQTSIADEIGRIDTALSGKADTATIYTKTETDSLLASKADKSYVDYSVNLGQGTYNGVYWIVREFYSFYLVEVGGTATSTFGWHTLVSVNKAYAPTMQRKVPVSSYDHNYFRGSIGFNNGNIELKVDEAAYVCGQFILPKDLI